MLNTTRCKEYLADVRATADKLGKRDKLEKELAYLDAYACNEEDDPEHTNTECVLTKDFAPLSFNFTINKKQDDGSYQPWFFGGLIFHGNHDGGGNGGAPTYSVCLTPQDGWSIHT